MSDCRTWLAGLAAAFVALPAMAAEFSTFQSLGFSEDGGVYAFEEYGISDSSGLAYSSIFFIDTVKDAFLPGTPIRIGVKRDTASIATVRREAMEKAAPLLSEHGLLDQPGELVAFNPISEVDAAKDELRYFQHPADPAFGKPYTLKIEEFFATPTHYCVDLVDALKAFRLKFSEKNGEPVDEIVHEDSTDIPESRQCTVDYRLGGVVTYAPPAGAPVHVALINVLSLGYEGNNGRWIAVPARP
ncbi:DUF2259 domain-containing protein [Rhizobium cremeum]|uniref:DUF2259 domain-containing protein n=1 Tax=Rhizobium cremeum TaxID=2813827 RepID=UPI001FD1505A|nr:DUF2259 domain-containing protein [Rhizobium cremeum]